MAVGEGEAGSLAVVAGRKIHHDGLREARVAIHLHDEKPVVDAILPLVQQHERHGRPGAGHLRQLAEDLPVGALAPAGSRVWGISPAADPHVHRPAAGTRHHLAGRILAQALVRRTTPNVRALAAVRPKRALLDGVVCVPVSLLCGDTQVQVQGSSARNPGIPCRRRAGWGVGIRKLISAVFRILPPGQHELAIVVHALDALGLDRRPAQCRPQQQRRENGNDGDDYQQLDQRETAKGTPVVPLH